MSRFLQRLRGLFAAGPDDAAQGRDALAAAMARLADRIQDLANEQQRLRALVESRSSPGGTPPPLDDQALLAIRRQQAFVSPGLDLLSCRVDDLVLSVPTEDIGHAATWLYEPGYDRGQRQLLRDLLAPGMTFVDVGANIGLFTALAARQVGPSGRVVAYEPIPRLVDVIRSNLSTNAPRTPAELKALCASARAERLRLQVYPQNNRVSTLAPYPAGAWAAASVPIEVASVRLDEDLASLERLDLLKIDAEGAECAVLEGAAGLFERFPHARVLCEFEPEHLQRAGTSAEAFVALCRRHGFEAAWVDDEGAGLRWVDDLGTLAGQRGNLLLSRSGRDLRRPLTILPAQLHTLDSLRAAGVLRTDGGAIRFEARTGTAGAASSDVLFFGPYIRLAAGRHAIRVQGEIDGSARLRLTADCGRELILDTLASSFREPFVIDRHAPADAFEVVCSSLPGLRSLTVTSIVIEPLP